MVFNRKTRKMVLLTTAVSTQQLTFFGRGSAYPSSKHQIQCASGRVGRKRQHGRHGMTILLMVFNGKTRKMVLLTTAVSTQ
jgi:hypothetical protein